MKKRLRGLIVFLCAFLLVVPAGAAGANLNGRWVSLQYGALSFSQAGNSFTAVWSGANAAGTMSGSRGTFRYWSGPSFEKCGDDSRGYGTLALSADGNTLSGGWANLSKKEPESGTFTALRLSSISGQSVQGAAPVLEEPADAQAGGTEPEPPGAGPAAGAESEQDAAGTQLSSTEPPDALNLLPDNLPPEYAGPIAEVMSDLEASLLKIFGVFDDGTGDETDAAPPPLADAALPEDTPLEENGSFWNFFTDLWTSLWGQ